MVIFNSYVSLPEGKEIGVEFGVSEVKPFCSQIMRVFIQMLRELHSPINIAE